MMIGPHKTMANVIPISNSKTNALVRHNDTGKTPDETTTLSRRRPFPVRSPFSPARRNEVIALLIIMVASLVIVSRLDEHRRSLVRDWRRARDRALALFDVCIDVIARVPVLRDANAYPRAQKPNDNGRETTLCTQTLLKQMEQLGLLLEQMDRERDALKLCVDDMEKAHRDATKALHTHAATTAVKKGGETTASEVMERIETSWRFYAEETSACEVLLGLCREAAATALAAESKKSNYSGEEMVRSARAFLEVRKKVELER